jgi:hypothetical protein
VRSEVMNSRRTADQGIPNPDRRLERVELMRNLGRGYHHGQRAAASHQQAGHMTAFAKEPSHQKALAKGPSTYVGVVLPARSRRDLKDLRGARTRRGGTNCHTSCF